MQSGKEFERHADLVEKHRQPVINRYQAECPGVFTHFRIVGGGDVVIDEQAAEMLGVEVLPEQDHRVQVEQVRNTRCDDQAQQQGKQIVFFEQFAGPPTNYMPSVQGLFPDLRMSAISAESEEMPRRSVVMIANAPARLRMIWLACSASAIAIASSHP